MIAIKSNIMKCLPFVSLILLLFVSLTACNEETGPTEQSSSEQIVGDIKGDALNKSNGPSANGQAILPKEVLSGYFQNFSFYASENEDGSIKGSIEFKCRQPWSGRVHGRIDCMTIEGTQATMSGVATHSDIPGYPPGSFFWFRVIDNGEGNNNSADQFSDIYGVPEGYPCTVSLPVDMFDIEKGDVQVNP
jgi:hypothetical protein